MTVDERHMTRALRLARRGAGAVEPNPMVGCVIVRPGGGRGRGGDEVIGEGWHRKFGGPHAEVNALADARERGGARAARSATVYVTLEPCRHTGKTPPCVGALIEAGVKRVVIGALDPHATSGGGVAELRAAGIDVVAGVCEAEARELIAPFAKVVTRGLPWVICKWAATIDGAIATAGGESQWISGEASRKLVHRLRGRVDAVMVGIGTALADDPLLTARGVRRRRIARRVVIDPSLRLPMKSKLVQTLDEAPLTIATSTAATKAERKKADALREKGVELMPLPMRRRKRLDLAPLLRHLVAEHGATNVLVEGGGVTMGALVDQGLADELLAFIGPKALGDPSGLAPLDTGSPVKRMASAIDARLVELRRVGDDALLRYWL